MSKIWLLQAVLCTVRHRFHLNLLQYLAVTFASVILDLEVNLVVDYAETLVYQCLVKDQSVSYVVGPGASLG